MAKFFASMPVTTYNDVTCKNITQRSVLTQKVRDESVAFYTYSLQDGDRPDTIAYRAYGDSYFDWLCYYANEIVDPYYGWCLSREDFDKHIIKKYGSIAEASERISHYRVSRSDATIDLAGYNALTSRRKKYWVPYTDEAGTVLYYKRSRIDMISATNAHIMLLASLNEANMPNFIVGEHVTQTVGGIVVASGDVVRVTANSLDLQHIQGTFVIGSVSGMSSDQQASVGEVISNGVTIHSDELVYWEPVSFYDYEQELNEQKREIKMLVPSVAIQTVRAHEEILNELV